MEGPKRAQNDPECTAFFAKIGGDFWRYGAEVMAATVQ